MEHCRGVGKSERHYQPFKRAVASAERRLPFVSGCDADQIIRMSEVDLGVDPSLPRCIQKIGDKWEWIPVLPSDLVESSVIDTETERTVLLLDEEN